MISAAGKARVKLQSNMHSTYQIFQYNLWELHLKIFGYSQATCLIYSYLSQIDHRIRKNFMQLELKDERMSIQYIKLEYTYFEN